MDLNNHFIDRIKAEFGHEADEFLNAIANDTVVSIRLNPSKIKNTEIHLEKVPWATDAYYLPQRPVFTLDPLFNVGAYYVQEASSMFLERAVKQHFHFTANSVVLDLCASPGGKSTLLSSLLSGDGVLVSNEYVSQRVAPLRENITKWGYQNSVVTNNAPSDFAACEGLFDLIAIDAPCSGEGMFRKDEQAVREWSVANVEMCAERQKSIVRDVYPALKDGGILVYSTCTYNTMEDEDNVKWICEELGGEYLPVTIDKEWGIVETEYGYHFYPHKTKGEGFFLAVIRKTSAVDNHQCRIKKEKQKAVQVPNEVKDYILTSSDFDFSITKDNTVIASPRKNSEVLSILKSNLKVVQSGVAVAQLKGKDIIPVAPLALSCILNKGNFAVVDADWNQSMSFLKKESFVLADAPKGWVLVTYKNVPLGWVKNLGNRINNSYPQEWHVRMSADANQYTSIII